MKRMLLRVTISIISILAIMAIYNYLDIHIFRKSLVKNYIDDSYLRPNFVAEFEKLKKEKEIETTTADSMKDLTLEEVISKHSSWIIGQRDVSLLREEWHFTMYDHLKLKKPEQAEILFRQYLQIKNEEILSIKKLEENFAKINENLLKENKNIKDGNYYKKFQTQYNAKMKLIDQTKEAMYNRKIELFGNELYSELYDLSTEFVGQVRNRLMYEYNLTETELDDVAKDDLSNKLLLMP